MVTKDKPQLTISFYIPKCFVYKFFCQSLGNSSLGIVLSFHTPIMKRGRPHMNVIGMFQHMADIITKWVHFCWNCLD